MTKAEQTRQRLFSATMELIGEKGFAATTVDEIVERAGVAKGTVYYHFKSKAELVEALIAQQPLAARVRAAAATGGTPTEQIVASLTAVVDFIRDNHDFARLLITEMWREDRVWRESLMMLRNGSINVIRDVILDGVSSG
jgi:AcrR family transcriptional regulator